LALFASLSIIANYYLPLSGALYCVKTMSTPGYKKAKKMYEHQASRSSKVVSNMRSSFLFIGIIFAVGGIYGIFNPEGFTTYWNGELVTGWEQTKVHIGSVCVGLLLLIIRFTILRNKAG